MAQLNKWRDGDIPSIPDYASNFESFMWRCTKLDREGKHVCCDTFVDADLPDTENIGAFKHYVENRQFVFWNPTHTTRLVIPTPRRGKNFAHLAKFMREASLKDQRTFWRRVANAIEEERTSLGQNEHLYISTHGRGVAFLHVRIERRPKYYDHNELDI